MCKTVESLQEANTVFLVVCANSGTFFLLSVYSFWRYLLLSSRAYKDFLSFGMDSVHN